MSIDTKSLERLVPDSLDTSDVTGQATLRLHVERYEFAAKYVRPGRLLDIACGAGFGTQILKARGGDTVSAVGVDIDPEAVAYASSRYAEADVEFRVSEAENFEDSENFDLIVSLETVEHVRNPGMLLARLVSLLRPGGVLVASVPTTPSVDLNPHHRHDFTSRSFRALLASHDLEEIEAFEQVQPVNVWSLLRRQERRMGDLRRNLPAYYLANPGAFARRIHSTLRYGFANRYLTLACQRPVTGGS
jgi:2-polyprenyl-3-methyl-5-hydroxy-6-metoxy-1,4-benzoquinol methylase